LVHLGEAPQHPVQPFVVQFMEMKEFENGMDVYFRHINVVLANKKDIGLTLGIALIMISTKK